MTNRKDSSSPDRYTSKIIKAGALLPDTKLLLAHWDDSADVTANLARIRQENIFGKASRSRIEDILGIFRQRYLRDPNLLLALAALVKNNLPAESLDRILYFQTAQADRLLHDVVLEVLVPLTHGYTQEVTVRDVEGWMRRQIGDGKTESRWSEYTTTRVAQGLLSTLRDFGILQGAVNKRITPIFLPTVAFAFIAFQLHARQRSGDGLLRHPAWQLFFLPQQAVERFFFEAHQDRLLEYHAAGPVIRIDFPTRSIQDYAYALAQRTS